MSFGIDTWILIILSALGVFAAFYFPIKKERKEKNSATSKKQKEKDENLRLKKKTFFWIISSIIIVLIGDLGWHLYKDKQPLLVFAGGGSVRNYLKDTKNYDIDVRDYRNSINIAIASGSAWMVLAEEYQFYKMKNRKFITICLSAGKMSHEFYSEYMFGMDDAIVASVYLGEDKLTIYFSDELSKNWEITENTSLEVLTRKLKDLINSKLETEIENKKRKVSIFTTNKTSGTLEAYKKCFQDSISFEEMIDNHQSYIFYDNMSAREIKSHIVKDGEYIVLGSEYYFVEGMRDYSLYLRKNKTDYIQKPMYLYFLAYQKDNNNNEFKIDRSIIKFLKKIKKRGLSISDQTKWEEIMKEGTIKYDKAGTSIDIIQIN